jgi:hypothetical protein
VTSGAEKLDPNDHVITSRWQHGLTENLQLRRRRLATRRAPQPSDAANEEGRMQHG